MTIDFARTLQYLLDPVSFSYCIYCLSFLLYIVGVERAPAIAHSLLQKPINSNLVELTLI